MAALFYPVQYLSTNVPVFTTVLKLMMLDIFMNFFLISMGTARAKKKTVFPTDFMCQINKSPEQFTVQISVALCRSYHKIKA